MAALIDELGPLVYLNANIVIYALEGHPQYESVIRGLLEAMDRGRITAATSARVRIVTELAAGSA